MGIKDYQTENQGYTTKYSTPPIMIKKVVFNQNPKNQTLYNLSNPNKQNNVFFNTKNNFVPKRLEKPSTLTSNAFYSKSNMVQSCRPNFDQRIFKGMQSRNFNFSMTNLKATNLNLYNDIQQRVSQKVLFRKNDDIVNIMGLNVKSTEKF